ncbi:MAG TPA: ribokinase [Candidatus Limiplasma sp.]|nr:ribokinase [Candidatus Limiplasma sp.]
MCKADKIVVFGSFVVDLTGHTEKFPVPGETVLGKSFKLGPGGKGSNQAVAAHRAGGNVTLVTKLGKDVFADVAKSFYHAEGMDTSRLLTDDTLETGTALIMVNEHNGQNLILVTIGSCGNITHADVQKNKALIQDADILLTQLEINLSALTEVIRLAHEGGTAVILNPAPAQALDDALLSMVDIITPNETEAETLTGITVSTAQDAAAAADVFFQKGVKKVIITMGEKGVYVNDGTRGALIPPIPVTVQDTTGAGDAFNGGLAVALAKHMDLFDAARFGNCTGALSVTKSGTAPAMPKRSDIEALYQAQYSK